MHNTSTVIKVDKFDISQIFEQKAYVLLNGWNLPLAHNLNPPKAYLVIDQSFLYWGMQIFSQAQFDQAQKELSHIEGMAQRDIAELFLYSSQHNHYFEMHINPMGSTWTQEFFGTKRQRVSNENPSKIHKVEYLVKDDYWQVSAQLKLNQIPIQFDRFNFCSISGQNPRQYYSLLKPKTQNADFHALVASNDFNA